MTNRRLWLLVFVGSVGAAAGGVFRPLPWLLLIAAAVAGWAAPNGRFGAIVAGCIAAVAWASAIGPWSGSIRWWAAVAAGVLLAGAVIPIAPRARRVAIATAAVGVVGALLFVRHPPTTGPAADDRLRAVDAYLHDQVDRGAVPGAAVAIVEDGEVVFARGYGRARNDDAMTPETPVVIGSTSKSITAVATLQLVEQNRVELDAPIMDYLPWLDPADDLVRAITVRQLLVDTSGVPTWAGWSTLAGDGRADLSAIRRLLNGVRLSSPPGQRFQYSNANYIILGQIIETVTGESYADVVRHGIFDPLGMTSSRAADTRQSTPNRYWLGLPIPSHLPYLEVGLPAGAITSSADDLARYLRAELDRSDVTLLSPASLRLSQKPAVKAEGFGVEPGRHYAMGWYTGHVAGERAVFHSGDVFDSSSSLIMLPDHDIGIAVVATTSSTITPVSKTLGEGVASTLRGRPAPDFARSLAVGTMLTIALAGLVLAFVVVRARQLIGSGPRVASSRSFARLAIVDFVVPVALLLGLPVLFGHSLDRAESVSAVQLWTLVTRGAPDVGLILVIALVTRAGLAAVVAVRSAARAFHSRNSADPITTPTDEPDMHRSADRSDDIVATTGHR